MKKSEGSDEFKETREVWGKLKRECRCLTSLLRESSIYSQWKYGNVTQKTISGSTLMPKRLNNWGKISRKAEFIK